MPRATHNIKGSKVANPCRKSNAGITPRQFDLLLFIHNFTSRSGLVPTNLQMRDALGLTSPATVSTHLDKLENHHGLIRREYGIRRNVILTAKGTRLVHTFLKGKSDIIKQVG